MKLKEKSIKEIVENDYLSQRTYLNNILSFLNKIDNNIRINLDALWGSGKTTFVKQIDYINNNFDKLNFSSNQPSNKVKSEFEAFNSKYRVLYFNAWENDHFYPLESIIYFLLNNIDNIEKTTEIPWDNIMNILISTGSIFINKASDYNHILKLIKNMVKGYKKIKEKPDNNQELLSNILTFNDQKNTIHELISKISNEKRICLIIDELDRCKPTYAVELLEIIKHLFDMENITILFVTNKKELGATIKQYYGSEFDGYKYLNKFFDFEIQLQQINKEDYISYKITTIDQLPTHFDTSLLVDNLKFSSNYFEMSYRDIDRIIQLLIYQYNGIIEIRKNLVFSYQSINKNIVLYLCSFLVYLISLKISNPKEYFNLKESSDKFEKYISRLISELCDFSDEDFITHKQWLMDIFNTYNNQIPANTKNKDCLISICESIQKILSINFM